MTAFPWLTLSIVVLALILVIALLALPGIRISQEEYRKTGKRPKGYYMGMGIALGLAIGLPLGIATDNIALGPALGLAIGTAIGAALEQRHAGELRPLTEREERQQRLAIIGGVVVLVAGVGVFLAILLAAR